jgi:DNA primase
MRIEQFERMGLVVRPGSREKAGEEFYICCPFCVKHGKTPDTQFKLGFNVKRRVYHCYRCRSRGSLADIKELQLLSFYQENKTLDKFQERLMAKPKRDVDVFDIDKISVPLTREDTPIAFQYMLNRGYTPEEIAFYSTRVGMEYTDEFGDIIYRWRGRVIFPFYYEGSCIYAVGRSYNGKEPKYLNSTLPKGLVVYGIDNIVGKVCILCEGIISAHAAQRSTGISAVSVLGQDPLDLQLARLRNKVEVLYNALDGDVEPAKRRKLNKKLALMGFQVYDIEMPYGEDPDSLKEKFPEYFQQAKRVSLF